MKIRRPATGSIAKITTAESKRSAAWQPRDLSRRPERRPQSSRADAHAQAGDPFGMDERLAKVVEILDEHTRNYDIRDRAVHCKCGWSHPDRFVANPDIHRRHVAQVLLSLLTEKGGQCESPGCDRYGYIKSEELGGYFCSVHAL